MVWDWVLEAEKEALAFGDDRSLLVVSDWEVRPGKLRVDDEENPRGDGIRFGKDYRAGQVVSFSLWVNGGNEEATLSGLAQASRVWRNDQGRVRGGSLCTLRHPRGRHTYGRPRGFSASAQRSSQGWVTAEADFESVDDLWYGPAAVTTVGLVPEFTGGLPVPAEVPFVLGGGTGVADSMVTVGGDTASWPVFELRGPIADPWVDVPGVGRLVFRGSLAYDQTLEVDTRPWARWVKRDGYAFPGALSTVGSRLSDMRMSPGAYQVIFGGYDPSGTSSLVVRVEPAFSSF